MFLYGRHGLSRHPFIATLKLSSPLNFLSLSPVHMVRVTINCEKQPFAELQGFEQTLPYPLDCSASDFHAIGSTGPFKDDREHNLHRRQLRVCMHIQLQQHQALLLGGKPELHLRLRKLYARSLPLQCQRRDIQPLDHPRQCHSKGHSRQ